MEFPTQTEFFFPWDWLTGTWKPETPTFHGKNPWFPVKISPFRRAQDVSRLGLAHGNPGGPREFGGGATLYALPTGRCHGPSQTLGTQGTKHQWFHSDRCGKSMKIHDL